MKLNKLIAAALLLISGAASAQENVTSEYIKNADFSQGTPITVGVTTYQGDAAKNNTTYSQLVPVEGWNIVENGDARAGGLVAFGSGVWIGGPGYTAPLTNSDGIAEGNILGVVGVWTGVAQYTQNVTLPADEYTLVLAVYNSVGGTIAFDKNLIGFIEDGGAEHLATTTVYPVNEWKYEFITFTLDKETQGKFSLGYKGANKGSGDSQHLFLSGIELYSGTIADQEAYVAQKQAEREKREAIVRYTTALKAANEALSNDDYANVTGAELVALRNEVAKAEPTTTEDYNAAAEALATATTAFTAAKATYDRVQPTNEAAAPYDLTPITVTEESTAASLEAQITQILQTLNTIVFNKVQSEYPYEIALGDWKITGNVKEPKEQHWNGNADATYNEPNYWNNNSGTAKWIQDIALPAGSYVLQIAGRRSGSSTLIASVKVGEELLASANDFPSRDSGYGIDLEGNANFDESGSYANNNAGHGWEWRELFFTITEDASVTISVDFNTTTSKQWASFTSYTIRSQFPKERIDLLNAIKVANAVDLAANVGTGAFQKDFVDDGTLAAAIATAQAVYDNLSASSEDIVAATEQLTSTKDAVLTDFNAIALNAPVEGQLFNIILTYAGWGYDNKAMTYIAGGRKDQGLYTTQYQAEANTNLAQAFTFTPAGETDTYYLSQIDADGNVRYLSTGIPYGGDTKQIRTVLEQGKALKVKVIATSTDGIYNLLNTEANNYLGSQDEGVYTVNSHINFFIKETQRASVKVNPTSAAYSTVILPFAAAVPEGLTAYSVEGIENEDQLVLTPAEELAANKPYVLEGTASITLQGDAQGTALTVTEGLLTGTYAEVAAPVGSYVLQNAGQAFYLVEAEAQPTVGANHAYLTAPEADVKVLTLGALATAVENARIATAEAQGKVFNLAGQRVSRAEKGIFIVNGKKVVRQ